MISSSAGTVVVITVKLAIALTSTTVISYMVSKFNSYEYKPVKRRDLGNESYKNNTQRKRERNNI